MAHKFSFILPLIWAAIVVVFLSYSIVDAYDLRDFSEHHGSSEEDTALSFNTLLSYRLATTFFLALVGYISYKTRDIARPVLLAAASYFLFEYGYGQAVTHLSDFRTYSYEVLLVGFYIWASLMLLTGLAMLLYASHFRKLLYGAIFLNCLGIILLTLEGRGSVEQIDLLIGGILVEQTWTMWKRSVTHEMLVVGLITIAAWPFIYTCYEWIKKGNISLLSWKNSFKTLGAFLFLIAVSMLSIPIGIMVNQRDIKEAQAFIDDIIPHIDRFYEENGEYPRDLRDIPTILDRTSPRLLNIFEYLSHNYKGAYYFSRPHKYCFIFKNPGKEYDYYSITNDRAWRASHGWVNLEEHYARVCDDGGPDSHEHLIGGHLGVSEFSNPLEELALDAEVVIRPAISQSATHKLKKAIEEYGTIDPSIYGDEVLSPFETGELPTIEALRFAIMKAPLEDPEAFKIEIPDGNDLNLSPEK